MDEMVLKAMVKWPNVPSCAGWLALDGRGDWYMRDDAAQAAGPFSGFVNGQPACLASKGSRLQHPGLVDFIGRNYGSDDQGRWYFQNGPQRVFVELSHAPWIWRIEATQPELVTSHTGVNALVQSVLMDDSGLVYVNTQIGLGLVHSQDMNLCAEFLEQGAWTIEDTMPVAQLPARYGFARSPVAMDKASAR